MRVDSHLYEGYVVPPHYDSLLAKVIGWGATRDEAIARLQRALGETVIVGVDTTTVFSQELIADPLYRSGELTTDFVASFLARRPTPATRLIAR